MDSMKYIFNGAIFITVFSFICGCIAMILGKPNAAIDSIACFNVARTSANIFIMLVLYKIYLKKK